MTPTAAARRGLRPATDVDSARPTELGCRRRLIASASSRLLCPPPRACARLSRYRHARRRANRSTVLADASIPLGAMSRRCDARSRSHGSRLHSPFVASNGPLMNFMNSRPFGFVLWAITPLEVIIVLSGKSARPRDARSAAIVSMKGSSVAHAGKAAVTTPSRLPPGQVRVRRSNHPGGSSASRNNARWEGVSSSTYRR